MLLFRRLVLCACSFLLLTRAAFAMSGTGCGGECSSCHALSVQEANQIVKGLGTVTLVKPAPVRGLYEITMVNGGKSAVAYMDYGKKHLIGGEIYDIAAHKVVNAPVEGKHLERLDPATLKTDAALVMGNPKGKTRLFVFTDPDCPFCAKEHAELKKLAALDPDLAIYIKLFPLKMHPHAYDKARVILGKKSLALLDKSYAGGKLPEPGAQDSKKPVDDTIRFAQSVGISSTPTLVLPDGRIMAGFEDAQTMLKLLKK